MRSLATPLLGLLALNPALALADAPDPSAWVVKITSGTCDQRRVFHGSGLLLQQGGKAYVLTSDHVLLHGNTGYCHSVWSPYLPAQQRALYLVADWGYGLGLLALPQTAPAPDWPRLEDVLESLPQDHAAAVVTGFPWASEQEVVNSSATVAEAASPQDFFAQIPTVIQLTHGQGEYGMSGGPVFTSDSKVLGILSHQKLEDQGGQQQNEVFAVPGPVARQWLERYFAAPDRFELMFFQTPENQVPGGLIVSGRWWWSSFAGDTLNPPSVAVMRTAQPATSRELPDPSGWLASVSAFFDQHAGIDSLTIVGTREGSALQYPEATFTGMVGLVPFLRQLMAGKGGRPVSEIYPNDWDKIVEQAGNLGKELDTLLRTFEGGYDPADGPPSEALPVLDGARELADKLMYADSERPDDPQAQAWQYVPGGDVQALLDGAANQPAWKSLAQWNAGRSQQLLDLLLKLQGVMSQLVF